MSSQVLICYQNKGGKDSVSAPDFSKIYQKEVQQEYIFDLWLYHLVFKPWIIKDIMWKFRSNKDCDESWCNNEFSDLGLRQVGFNRGRVNNSDWCFRECCPGYKGCMQDPLRPLPSEREGLKGIQKRPTNKGTISAFISFSKALSAADRSYQPSQAVIRWTPSPLVNLVPGGGFEPPRTLRSSGF